VIRNDKSNHKADHVRQTPTAFVRVSRYEVSCLAPEHRSSPYFTIAVEDRGDDRWAVLHWTRCLSSTGSWDREPPNSEREDDWLEAHRFDLHDALELAKREAPRITHQGRSVGEVMARANRAR
jgi:hypothetical protein